ncbi:hypothetical protein [Aliarcobacter cibarius]|uniref:Uncharacterized protein n=1 Tax=Aliarcobacter cibarius TaxID=255507 RepID=A0ABY2V4I4_9BACT|nr:hypothetical protein [Aliarcobacter cibarius]TLS99588.1 hypothetical protein FE247_05765 [Aliarcobacter cibarius]TLT00025.1 hypothetical protein FE245_06040 [Aliarcobacter cibarius]
MNTYDLFIELLTTEDEEKIKNILIEYDIWDNPNCWKPYGNMENNIGTIANQQTNPFAAFTEKVVNSIDAIFMRECKREGINPESKEAPQSLNEAKIKYRDSILKDDIQIYATGNSKESMNLIIADNGEGQAPSDFEKTLLSLNKSNKLKIQFVQGKFNMGSTGVIPFCGKYNFQLIVSKKDPKIFVDDELADYWSFTLTRKNSFDKTRKSSLIEYLIIDGKTPFIKKSILNILPNKNKASDTYSQPMEWGTYIKLYDYKTKHSSVIKTRFMYKISQLLPGMPISAFISDRRDVFETASNKLTTFLKGNLERMLEKKRLVDGFPISNIVQIEKQNIKIDIYLVKNLKEDNTDYTAYKDGEGIAYVINGQVHGYTSDRIFLKKGIDLNYIQKNLLIYADVTDLDLSLKDELLMSNRESLRDSIFKNQLEDLIIEEIKNNERLKIENQKVRNEQLKNKTQNDEHIVSSLKKILKNTPSIAVLFDIGKQMPNFTEIKEGTKDKVNFVGSDIPTYFDLIGGYSLINPKEVAVNKKFKIQFKTDSVNDLFTRENNKASFELINEEGFSINYSLSLTNGKCSVLCSLPEGIKINDLLSIKTIVKIDEKTFNNDLHIKIIKEIEIKDNSSRKKKKKDNPSLNLPNLIEIKKDDWVNHNFNETSVLKVMGNDYIINMDNVYLLKNIKKDLTKEIQLKEEYKAMFLMYGIALEYSNNENDSNSIDVEKVTSALAPLIFETNYIIQELKK